jgi:uncharacterized protein with von Willebrand factor type A (vWA) domain
LGGVVHTYQKYDPKNFPSPTAPPPDMASAAFEHMMAFGSMRDFTEEELANAIHIDASMFPRLGPSIESLRAMLEERKRKILDRFEVDSVQECVHRDVEQEATRANPPKQFRKDLEKAVRERQIRDLEELYYKQRDDQAEFSKQLARLIDRVGEQYQIEELASKYEFRGQEELSVEEAIAVKDELEAIDKLLEQLKEAQANSRLAIIDMGDLEQMADSEEFREQIESLNQIQQQIEDYVREQARAQGLEMTRQGYQLSPQAYRLFQRKLLHEIFAELQAARSGRHTGPIVGEGTVEIERTKDYEFGDSVATMDVSQTVVNAVARATVERRTANREGQVPSPVADRLSPRLDDISIHRTKNNPKCASMVLLDMSGSMRHGGQYINCKRMAIALDGLIRSEYPGDSLGFVEMASFAKRRTAAELPALLPKPVSIHNPVVRLRVDMSNTDISERQIPQHFTNIQHALQLSRQALAVQDTPNRQIMLITDGLPTAHFDGSMLFLLYPPDPMTEEATMREARLCAREGITINIFLIPSWSQSSEDIQFAQRMAHATRGRVFFTGGKDLDRFVLWDYVKMRRKIIG